MSKFWLMMDEVAYSLNELIDLVLHSILFAFIVSVAFGGTYGMGFALFFVIPGFILCAPLVKKIHNRYRFEWILKIPIYTLIGLMVYAISYAIIANNIDISGRTNTNTTIAVIFIFVQAYWVWSTLKRLSKPPIPRQERLQRKKKRLFTSLLFALGSFSISITSFAYQPSVTSTGDWSAFGDLLWMGMGVIIGIFFLITGLIMTTFFFASLVDPT